ncbi:hypothetical protein NYE70_25805 [Paenibacillus sp. FSL R5-0407]|uniref:hypothetical protein n=1 Tax=Paenibacillus sp. FSL R5-0407 TaxID=2975320 RepID=UPI0030FD185E
MLSKETMNKIDELVSRLAEGHLKMVKENGVYWSDDLKDFGELLKNLASIQTPVVVSPSITVNGGEVGIDRIIEQMRYRMEQQTKKGKSSDRR